MSYIQISQKINKLFDDIPEFNSGNITYDSLTLSNATFGGTTTQEELSSTSYDFITSLSLSITLPALTDTDHIANSGGYISWVNNIGHSIIDGIDFKINNEVITDSGFPYDKWLDIHNENNDVDNNEDDGLGKYPDNSSRDKYDNQQVNLEVPLHFWMTDYTKNAFPFFLITNGKIRFSLKLKPLASLIYYSPIGIKGDINDTIQPTIKLNIGSYQINDLQLKNNLKTQSFQAYFNFYTFNSTTLSTSNNIRSPQSAPLKQIEIVVVANTRETNVTNLDSIIEINKEDSDINNNDYLNYSATSDSVVPGLLHSLDDINITINGIKHFGSNLSAEFIRKISSLENVVRTPDKYIYNIAFTPKAHTGETYGVLDMENVTNMFLTCTNITGTTSTIFSFFTHIRKMIIKSGDIEFDNWSSTDIEFKASGFKFGDSSVSGGSTSIDKPLEDLTVEEITEIKQDEEVFKIATTTNIYNSFLVFDVKTISNSVYLDVILGDNISPNMIEGILKNLKNGSLNKYGIFNYIFEIVDIKRKTYTEPKAINEYMKTNILREMIEAMDENPNASLESLFTIVLPFSKGFYINVDNNIRRLDYWLNDNQIKKHLDELTFYVSSLMLNNEAFNSRIYTIQINKTIDVRTKPYKEDYTYWDNFILEKTNLFYLEYNNIKPSLPIIVITASELHPTINEKLSEDLTSSEFEEQLGIRIDCSGESRDIDLSSFKETIFKSYKDRLDYLQTLTENAKGSANYKKYYDRLQSGYKISQGITNKRFMNVFSIFTTYNINILIKGVGEVTVTTFNEYMKNKDLSGFSIHPETHSIEFNFLYNV
jgi:hypothetical protein